MSTLNILKIFVISSLASMLLTACQKKDEAAQGYVEGNFTYISPQVGGTLEQLMVKRGDNVEKNQALFKLNLSPEDDQLNAAIAAATEAKAKLQDLLTGKRQPVIQALIAEKKSADSKLIYSRKQYKRYKNLLPKGYISKQAYDRTRQEYKTALENVEKANQDIINAKLRGRINRIFAAQAAFNQARAKIDENKWRVSQKMQFSPFTGIVYDTYFYQNETVKENQPVLSLLSPKDLRIIFYVSAKVRSQLKIGQIITFHANNTKKNYQATINYMSDKAEYTPPFIYSESNINNLVFEIKAKLNTNKWVMWPGQPVLVDFKTTLSAHKPQEKNQPHSSSTSG